MMATGVPTKSSKQHSRLQRAEIWAARIAVAAAAALLALVMISPWLLEPVPDPARSPLLKAGTKR